MPLVYLRYPIKNIVDSLQVDMKIMYWMYLSNAWMYTDNYTCNSTYLKLKNLVPDRYLTNWKTIQDSIVVNLFTSNYLFPSWPISNLVQRLSTISKVTSVMTLLVLFLTYITYDESCVLEYYRIFICYAQKMF